MGHIAIIKKINDPTMCNKENSVDEVDKLPSKDRVTNLDIAGFVISIISHIIDVGLDCNLAYRYYNQYNMECFLATLGFILVPALINTAFSIRMYVMDQSLKAKTTLTKRFTKRTVCCMLVLVFQLAPVLRYFDALRYAIKSRKAEKIKDVENQRRYYELMVKEDSDVALLRVLECFLEAAPQQILQLAIIFHTHGEGIDELTIVHQLLSIGSSFVSMAWSMASYQRLLRFSLKDKNNISWAGTIIQFMWHFLVTVSRILCISVIASVYLNYTILGVFIHWFSMAVWLHAGTSETNFCDKNKIYDSALFGIFGMVYVFTYVNLTEGRTFYKYLFFYTILFLENTAANIFWILKPDDKTVQSLYYTPVVYLNIIPFILGIIFMMLYYKVFHPSTGCHANNQRSDRS